MTQTQHREYRRFIARCTPIPIDFSKIDLPLPVVLEALRVAGFRVKQDGRFNFYIVLREDLK